MEQAILAAAGELFDQQGFNQTSLQDIADALGMARPSLYHYFENRDQILATGIDAITVRRDELLDELTAVDGDPVRRLELLVDGLARLIVENRLWISVLFNDGIALPPDARERDIRSREAFYDALTDVIRDGIASGHFRELDARATALTVVSALSGLQGDYLAGESATTEDAEQLATDIILRGVLESEPLKTTPFERGVEMVEEGLALVREDARIGQS